MTFDEAHTVWEEEKRRAEKFFDTFQKFLEQREREKSAAVHKENDSAKLDAKEPKRDD